MNETTTIELKKATRDKLKAERKGHESNYNDTIERLLDSGSGGQLWTEREIRELARTEIESAQGRY